MLALLGPGELFPRIAATSGLLLFDVRPAPTARPTTRLTYSSAADPRTQPLVKGPDFGRLRAHRTLHQRAGTDDTAIVDAAGAMLETTTGALVMWDKDTLVVPDGMYLPSVTLAQAQARATELGLQVTRASLTLEMAHDHPLWFLNSLHGVSPVSELFAPEGVIHPPAHPDVAAWQRWWWDGFTPARR